MKRPDPDGLARLSSLLDELLELPPAARPPELERRLADAPGLLPAGRRMLGEAAAAEAEEDTPGWSADAPAVLGQLAGGLAGGSHTGRQLGPWRLLEQLGRGGMGEVYLAERADGQFEMRAALKLLDRTIDSEAAREVFRHERQVLAQLEHPHIARLLDGGISDEGLPWFVMELVEGVRVDEWCDARGASVADRVGLLLRACEAVAAAHRAGVVHRDLKPGNILVGGDGMPRLLDFGIATSRGGEGPGGAAYTPGYAAPEQVAGREVGPAADVYSLAVVLHELLAGEGPDGATTGELEPGLAELLDRCRDDEPTRRPADAGELAAGLRGWLRSRPRGGRAPRTLAGLGLVAALAAGLWLGRGALAPAPAGLADGPPRVAVEAFGPDHAAIGLAAATRLELERVPGLVALAARTTDGLVLAGELRDRGPELALRSWLVDVAPGDTLWIEDHRLPARHLAELPGQLALRVAEGLALPVAPGLAAALSQPATRDAAAWTAYARGLRLLEEGHPEQAGVALREAVDRDSSFAPAWAALGRTALLPPGEPGAPPPMGDHASPALERALRLDPGLPGARVDLARTYLREGRLAQAQHELATALGASPHHPGALWELGDLWRRAGELERAISLGEDALELDPALVARPFLALLHAGREPEFLGQLDAGGVAAAEWRAVAHLRQGDELAALQALRRSAPATNATAAVRTALRASLEGSAAAGRAALAGVRPQGDADTLYLVAVAHARLGSADGAREWLARAVAAGFPCAPCFAGDPLLAPLRAAGQLEPVLEDARIRARALHAQAP